VNKQVEDYFKEAGNTPSKKKERKYEHLGKFNELQCTLCDQHKPHQMIQCE